MLVNYGALNREKDTREVFFLVFFSEFLSFEPDQLQSRPLDSEKQRIYDKASAPRDKGVLNFYI